MFSMPGMDGKSRWQASLTDTEFILRKTSIEGVTIIGIHPLNMLYSPRDYARFQNTTVLATYERMLSELDVNDVHSAGSACNDQMTCAWIIMLLNEFDATGSGCVDVRMPRTELVPAFLTLKDKVMAKLGSESV